MLHANQTLGEEAFKLQDWRVIGEYVNDNEGGRHQAFYSPVKDVVVLGETIRANERIQVEQSLKYSQSAATKLWDMARVTTVDQWTLGQEYGESMSDSTLYHFSTLVLPQAAACLRHMVREGSYSPTLLGPIRLA